MEIQSIAVFCGSKAGNNPLFVAHAKAIGIELAKRGITLVYGGGKAGIMGAIANEVVQNGGKVLGIMPTLLRDIEQHHTGIDELIIVDNMHTRKQLIYESCDAAIILPGGYGTLDELFEIITWNNLKIHTKKLFLMNTDGFYNHLLQHLEMMHQAGFLYQSISETLIIADNPDAIFSYF